jgi:hypothetical protein
MVFEEHVAKVSVRISRKKNVKVFFACQVYSVGNVDFACKISNQVL